MPLLRLPRWKRCDSHVPGLDWLLKAISVHSTPCAKESHEGSTYTSNVEWLLATPAGWAIVSSMGHSGRLLAPLLIGGHDNVVSAICLLYRMRSNCLVWNLFEPEIEQKSCKVSSRGYEFYVKLWNPSWMYVRIIIFKLRTQQSLLPQLTIYVRHMLERY